MRRPLESQIEEERFRDKKFNAKRLRDEAKEGRISFPQIKSLIDSAQFQLASIAISVHD